MYKSCCVPLCDSTSVTTPDKLFFTVPHEPTLRFKWLKATGRDLIASPVAYSTSLYCCEDHFNVEEDMENYVRYKISLEYGIGKKDTRKFIRRGVLPHKFSCQPLREGEAEEEEVGLRSHSSVGVQVNMGRLRYKSKSVQCKVVPRTSTRASSPLKRRPLVNMHHHREKTFKRNSTFEDIGE